MRIAHKSLILHRIVRRISWSRHPVLWATLAYADLPDQLGAPEREALFAVGRATAFCLLAQFGAQINAAGVLQVHRQDLLTQLEAVPQSGTYQAWAGGVGKPPWWPRPTPTRRNGAGLMAGTPDFAPTAHSFRNLPPGVTVVPGRVLFEFTFPEEFWALVDEFANLCAQDRAGFEGAVTVRPPAAG